MIFNTVWFLWFFLAAYALLWLLPLKKARFYFVLAASVFFHAHFAGPAGVAPIVVMAAAVFLLAPRLEQAEEGKKRKRILALGLAVPVAGLVYYKYRAFLIGNLLGFWPDLAPMLKPLAGSAPMPLAISFFTFEFVHYLVDVYKGNKAIRNPFMFALFCVYFPSIVSGPIKRYEDFCAQIDEGIPHPARNPMALQGLGQLLLGFFKKLVVADTVAQAIHLMDAKTGWGRWQVVLLMVLLSIRILFDFSGYSDIAIGCSRLLGLKLPQNFNFPYLALNPSDFWRRWHMSLSSWIRDYVYIPLGGSRQGFLRRIANGLLAMVLCGFWHGAAWNFAAWGLYHGMGLAAHGAWARRDSAPRFGFLGRALAWGSCLCFVAYGWLIFFYPMDKVFFFTRKLLGG